MVAQDSSVTAKIYDVTGKQIRMIELGHVTAGNYVESNRAIYWDGRSENGEMVASGTYFYQIQAGDYTDTKKMVNPRNCYIYKIPHYRTLNKNPKMRF